MLLILVAVLIAIAVVAVGVPVVSRYRNISSKVCSSAGAVEHSNLNAIMAM
jgi:hypothetical protein